MKSESRGHDERIASSDDSRGEVWGKIQEIHAVLFKTLAGRAGKTRMEPQYVHSPPAGGNTWFYGQPRTGTTHSREIVDEQQTIPPSQRSMILGFPAPRDNCSYCGDTHGAQKGQTPSANHRKAHGRRSQHSCGAGVVSFGKDELNRLGSDNS